jgi:hypothetical protein
VTEAQGAAVLQALDKISMQLDGLGRLTAELTHLTAALLFGAAVLVFFARLPR